MAAPPYSSLNAELDQRMELRAAQSRLTWEKEMGDPTRRVWHDETSVLLLGWEKALDDTGAGEELDDLAEVFTNLYGFGVETKLFHTKTRPQAQAFKHLGEFVEQKDGPKKLLIVYYAGHGWTEASEGGKISLSGRYPCNSTEKDEWSIEWTEVERTLSRTSADVLVVFDCCHAGLLCKPAWRGSNRCYQFIGACAAPSMTKIAGKDSFTTAMVWALRKLAPKRGFGATELVGTLQTHEHFPKDQFPVIWSGRFEFAPSDVWICPTPSARDAHEAKHNADADEDSPETPYDEDHDTAKTQHFLELRFHFAERLTDEMITSTAHALKGLQRQKLLTSPRITFINCYSPAEWAASQWKRQHMRRKTMSTVARPTVVDDTGSEMLQVPLLQTSDLPPTPALTATQASSIHSSTPLLSVDDSQHLYQPSLALFPKNELAYHLGKVAEILVSSLQPLTPWHPTAFL